MEYNYIMNKKKLDKWMKIITLIFSFVSLIISIIAMFISYGGYMINKKKFDIETKENLEISIGTGEVESIHLKTETENDFASYRLNISICFVNTSNLPIYIDDKYIDRYIPLGGGKYSVTNNLEIHDLDLPILIEPQETKYIKCHIQIPIPENVNQYIVDNFGETENLDVSKIGEYLFFEKKTDMIGNEVKIINKNEGIYYKYNPTIPFHISFYTSKGNSFSSDYYTGLCLPGIAQLDDKYKGINLEVRYGKETLGNMIINFIQQNIMITFIIAFICGICIGRLYKKILKRYKVRHQENNT